MHTIEMFFFVPFHQINVSLHEKPGINLLEVEGSLASKDLASALTKSHVDQKVYAFSH